MENEKKKLISFKEYNKNAEAEHKSEALKQITINATGIACSECGGEIYDLDQRPIETNTGIPRIHAGCEQCGEEYGRPLTIFESKLYRMQDDNYERLEKEIMKLKHGIKP